MPLVSGVCRTASAPMLSHGGSRLNASKPEANPKTRYPPNNNTLFSQHIQHRLPPWFVSLFFSFREENGGRTLTVEILRKSEKPLWHLARGGEKVGTRIACRSLLLLLLSFCHFGNSLQKGSRSNRLSNHCRLRGLWWRQVFS